MERLFRPALARDDAKRPIRNFLPAGEPFVRPGEKNRSSQTALHHAVDMPAKHFGLLLLRMPDRVHPEFSEDERMFAREILQSEQIALEIALIVKINIETGKIGILRKQILGRRIRRVRKERIRI